MIYFYRYGDHKLLVARSDWENQTFENTILKNYRFNYIGQFSLLWDEVLPRLELYRDYCWAFDGRDPNLSIYSYDIGIDVERQCVFRLDPELLDSIAETGTLEKLPIHEHRNNRLSTEFLNSNIRLLAKYGLINVNELRIDINRIEEISTNLHIGITLLQQLGFYYFLFGEKTVNLVLNWLDLSIEIKDEIIKAYQTDKSDFDQNLIDAFNKDPDSALKFLPEKLKLKAFTIGLGNITPEEYKIEQKRIENFRLEWQKKEQLLLTPFSEDIEVEKEMIKDIYHRLKLGYIYTGIEIKETLTTIYRKFNYPHDLIKGKRLMGIDDYYEIKPVRGGYRFDLKLKNIN